MTPEERIKNLRAALRRVAMDNTVAERLTEGFPAMIGANTLFRGTRMTAEAALAQDDQGAIAAESRSPADL